MKLKYSLFVAPLLLAFYITSIPQTKQVAKVKAPAVINHISILLGKPVYQSTVDSLNSKVWIITQKKHASLLKTKLGKTMNVMKDKNTKMDKLTNQVLMSGTHFFVFDVHNILKKKNFADSSAKVEVVSPSKINTSVILKPMMNYFGSGISLAEKGEYLFTINLNIGAGYQTSQFKYRIK